MTRLAPTLMALLAFVIAALVATTVAWTSALMIERRAAAAITSRLLTEGFTWASVQTDGLAVELSGTAPNEAARFRAVNIVGSVVDTSRVRDRLDVAPAKAVQPPEFSIEMLRNDDGIQLIGLLPAIGTAEEAEAAIEALRAEAEALNAGTSVSDMLETAAFPAPAGWDAAFAYGLEALRKLPRSKISVSADRVEITAIAGSETEKRSLETDLARSKPEGLTVLIDISAPRPVLTPFTLRFLIDERGARFDACAADTEAARTRIIAAAAAAGLAGRGSCTIGLGVPTPRWAEAAEAGIRAIAALGAGTITFSDADVSLLASEDTPQAGFDRVVGELQTALPDVFSLTAILPKKAAAAPSGPAEFTATLAEGDRVELRGRLTDETLRDAVESYAKAQFGVSGVYTATRPDAELPDGWPVRVLTGLEALSLLETGALLVRADTVEVSGITGSLLARDRISQLLSAKLGPGETFKVDVTYDEDLDPLAALPTPDECAAAVTGVLARRKITFPPGSAEIDAGAGRIMDALAEALADCPNLGMEIAGHTDSQGSEDGNRALSQARADAVRLALQGRSVAVGGFTAVGYGEANPIADNSSKAGRDENRRIEFTLKGGSGPVVVTPTAGTGAKATIGTTTAGAPDFSADTSPSVAPVENTLRPKPRPDQNG